MSTPQSPAGTPLEPAAASAAGLGPGDRHYRAFVGPPERYDLIGALQFNLLTCLGLREHHTLLDIGCGSLRAGRLFLAYLLPGKYFGVEPERWLVEEGIDNEVGRDLVRIKKPRFRYTSDFSFGEFGTKFDFVIAHSIFSHASESQILECLQATRGVLHPEGLFAATYVRGDADEHVDGWVYPKCVRYREARLRELAVAAGLTLYPIPWPHPKQQWLLLCHPERGEVVLEKVRQGLGAWPAPHGTL